MADDNTPSDQLTGSLFDRIKGFFNTMWQQWWSVDVSTATPLISTIIQVMEDQLGAGANDYFKVNLTKTMNDLGFPDEIKTVINKLIADNDLGSFIGAYFLVYYYYWQYIGQHANVASQLSTHFWNQQYRPTISDPNTLIRGLFRDPADATRIKDELGKLGFSDERINTLLAASKSILAPDEYKKLFLRGEIDEQTLNAGLKKYGFNDSEIAGLKTLFYPIPAYPDLVRMAVREAFYPEYIEEYGLMKELPAEFLDYSGQQGLSEEWAKRFWASHWELPSLRQGFEMLHRDVIETKDLNKLFMAVDIMPWWRDKLEAISYNPLTRVDVRRVYRMGIINRDQVKRTYLDLGYNDEKAEWLTKFTELQNTEQDRDLTKAEILSSFAKKIINETDCKKMLGDLGYNEEEVNILISTKEYTTFKEIKDNKLKQIKKYYLAGAYTVNQAINELGKIDIGGAEQTSLLQLWDADKLAKLKSPSKADLDKFFTNGIIPEGTYRQELQNQGYTYKYIEWYIQLINISKEG